MIQPNRTRAMNGPLVCILQGRRVLIKMFFLCLFVVCFYARLLLHPLFVQLISQLTSKLRAQLQDELSLKAMLTEDLVAQETQIQQHAKEIDAKLQQMRSQIQTFQQVKQQLQAKNDEIRTWLQQNETRAITVEDADRLCYPKDTWSKQLLECVSLDYAIDDAYYVLDRCLANEKIDLRTYTKQIRNLAHQQFYARALLQRIQKQQQQQQGNNNNLMSMPMPMPMPAVGAVPSYPAGYPL